MLQSFIIYTPRYSEVNHVAKAMFFGLLTGYPARQIWTEAADLKFRCLLLVCFCCIRRQSTVYDIYIFLHVLVWYLFVCLLFLIQVAHFYLKGVFFHYGKSKNNIVVELAESIFRIDLVIYGCRHMKYDRSELISKINS